MALVKADGHVVEFLSYEGAFTAAGGPADGMTSIDIGVAESSSPVGQSLARDPTGVWSGPAASTFRLCNSSPPPPPSSTITFSGRLPSDPSLPVGFEDQLFATLHDPSGAVVTTTFTWHSEPPDIPSIDANGVMHALTAGTATGRATAQDGPPGTYSLPTRLGVCGGPARNAGNTGFA